MNVTLPNGQVINGVPEGTSKDAIMQKAISSGLAQIEDFPQQVQQPAHQEPLEQLRDLTIQRSKLPLSDTSLDEQISGLRQQTGELDISQDASQFKPANLDFEPQGMLGSLAQGFKQGAADMGTGMVNMFNELRVSLGDKEAQKVIDNVSAANTMRRMETEAQTKEHPIAAFAGEVVGGAVALPLPIAKGATALTTIGKSIGLGATGGVVHAKGTGGDATKEALIGGAIGGAIPIVGPKLLDLAKKGISKSSQKIASVINSSKEFKPGELANKLTGVTAKQKRSFLADQVKQGSVNTETVAKMLNETGQIVTNPKAKTAINLLKISPDDHEGLITMSVLENMSKASKQRVGKMLDTIKLGRNDPDFRQSNRVTDVVGDAIGARAEQIARINKSAGKRIGAEAEKLSGKAINISGATKEFQESLSKLGVTIDDEGILNFANSRFVGGGQDKVQRISNFVSSGKMDGLEAHETKQFIRELVSFGKGTESAISEKSSGILKDLARNIDTVLDKTSKGYEKANERFAATIGVKDKLQKMAGKDALGNPIELFGDEASSSFGTMARRIVSNARTRTQINNTLKEADEVLKGFNINFKDDISSLNTIATYLEDSFRLQQAASFQGGIERGGAATVGGNIARGVNPKMALIDAGIKAVAPKPASFEDKLKGLRLLIEEGKK